MDEHIFALSQYERTLAPGALEISVGDMSYGCNFQCLVPPVNDFPRPPWTNSVQTSTENLMHAQSTSNNGNTSLCRSKDQSNSRDFSSINWLSTCDQALEDWIFGSSTLNDDPQVNREHAAIVSGEVGQSNPVAHDAGLFPLSQAPYQTPGRISPGKTPFDGSPTIIIPDDHKSSTADGRERSPQYYVDGGSARATSSAKRKRTGPMSKGADSNGSSHYIESDSSQPDAEAGKSNKWISADIYEAIQSNLSASPHLIPPWDTLCTFIQLYFDKFHCVFPLLEKNNICGMSRTSRTSWILVLAMGAVGSVYDGSSESRKWGDGWHAFIRKALDLAEDGPDCRNDTPVTELSEETSADDLIVLVQARIINVLGMLHSGNPSLIKYAHFGRSVLVQAAYEMDLLRPADRIYHDASTSKEDKLRACA